MPSPSDYSFVVMPDDNLGYVALCPSFASCMAFGETREDALDAAVFELERLADQYDADGRELPSPQPPHEPSPQYQELALRLRRMQTSLDDATCQVGFARRASMDEYRRSQRAFADTSMLKVG